MLLSPAALPSPCQRLTPARVCQNNSMYNPGLAKTCCLQHWRSRRSTQRAVILAEQWWCLWGLWVKSPLQHLQQTWPAKGFLFLPRPPPGMPWCLEIHPGLSLTLHGHRGERGRVWDIILALLNPRPTSLLLLVIVRGSGEIYWSAANLRQASSKPHDTGSHFTKIFQPRKSEASLSSIYSHKLCGFL